jgi:hypothetical protein
MHVYQAILMERHADARTAELCSCGTGSRCIARCVNCIQYAPTCPECFIAHHHLNPLHWVEIWDAESGFFRRYDICSIPGVSYSIPLGHNGARCKWASETFHVNLVDLGGIHATRVQYCACGSDWQNEKAQQLLRAGFFPATPDLPQTAFSFQLLKHFHNHPQIVYEFAEGLRRTTNNAFTSKVPVRDQLRLRFIPLNSSIGHLVTASCRRTGVGIS